MIAKTQHSCGCEDFRHRHVFGCDTILQRFSLICLVQRIGLRNDSSANPVWITLDTYPSPIEDKVQLIFAYSRHKTNCQEYARYPSWGWWHSRLHHNKLIAQLLFIMYARMCLTVSHVLRFVVAYSLRNDGIVSISSLDEYLYCACQNYINMFVRIERF